MDTMPAFIVLCITWCALMSRLVTGIPFLPINNIPTPYAVPRPHTVRPSSAPQGFLSNSKSNTHSLPGMCPTPIPIVNRSMSCDHSHFRRLELSDDMLKQVLTEEGGSYVSDYMASSDDEAQQNFKNLMSLNDLYEDVDFEPHPSDWSWDYSLTKRALLSQLDAAYKKYYATTTLYHKQPLPDHGDVQQREGDPMLRVFTGENFNIEDRDNLDLSSALKSDPREWRDIKVNIPLHILTKVLPAQYVYPEHIRHRRNIDGTTSEMEYCRDLGSQTSDGYYYLCSTCAHTTTLGTSYFPRIINELWCNTDSKGCMYVGGTAHGSCRQSVFYMTMLRKKPNSCMTVIKDGRHYITDEWERYAQPIKVGCECVIDKRSPFVQHIKP